MNKEPSCARGLGLLTDREFGRWPSIDQDAKHAVGMKKHPFDLDLPPISEIWSKNQDVMWIETGATEISVRVFVSHLIYSLGDCFPVESQPKRLRIINAQCNEQKPDHHFVYFEVWTGLGVYICGDCTDCSGEGGYGTLQLRSLFMLLNKVFEVDIEEIEIDYHTAINLISERNDFLMKN